MIYGGCNCGACHITILPTGDIFACRRVAESKVGNVFEDRLADVWLTSIFTVWGSLFQCLRLTPDDKLLIRGATCALGYVAIQLAKTLGCTVAGTTHKEDKLPLLEQAGCDECILDNGKINGKIVVEV